MKKKEKLDKTACPFTPNSFPEVTYVVFFVEIPAVEFISLDIYYNLLWPSLFCICKPTK